MVSFEPVHIKLKNLFRDETPQLQVVKSNLHNNNNKKNQDDFVLSDVLVICLHQLPNVLHCHTSATVV